MKQLIFIWGWEVFDTQQEYYDSLRSCDRDLQNPPPNRKSRLCSAVSLEYECLVPQMPNNRNADYVAWKIWFEKYFWLLSEESVVLIWYSLWWIFLLKWLSENDFPKTIGQLHLVAPVSSNSWLVDEVIWNFEFDFSNLPQIEKQCDEITIYHSKDDPLVPYAQSEELVKHLPKARLETFGDRWHFFQPAFPELLENIGVYTR